MMLERRNHTRDVEIKYKRSPQTCHGDSWKGSYSPFSLKSLEWASSEDMLAKVFSGKVSFFCRVVSGDSREESYVSLRRKQNDIEKRIPLK